MSVKKYPHVGRAERPLDAAHWDQRYLSGDTPWDHGQPSPGLVDFLASQPDGTGRILVPGCGWGHDCREWARHGFAVTGLDVSPQAIQCALNLASDSPPSPPVQYVVADFLGLPSEFHGVFDWVFEHTCFCAIDPARRDDYVRSSVAALKPGGRLLGVFFNIQPQTGPPFGTTRSELCDRFGPHFDLESESIPRSFPNREGEELLMLWRKKV